MGSPLLPGGSGPPAATSAPASFVERILGLEGRIFEAEATLFEELARAAPDRIRDTEWLRAAAKKECCAARVIEALAEKERVLGKHPPPSGGAAPGGAPPPQPAPSVQPFPQQVPGEPIEEVPFGERGEDTGTRDTPESDAPQEPPKDDGDGDGVCKHGCNVLLQSGEERLDRTDLAIPGRGNIHFMMSRRYRSRLNYDGPLGFGWTSQYDEKLLIQPNGDVVRFNGGSHLDRWSRNPDGTFAAPRGHFRTLVQAPDGSYLLRSPSGFKRFYRADGKLDRYEDRNGNTMLFRHDPRGNLRTVIDPYGRAIEFLFQSFPNGFRGTTDRLVAVRDFIGREVLYTYDGNGDLVAVRSPVVTGTSTGNDFPRGRTERYTYTAGFTQRELNHKILSVTSPEEVAVGGPPFLSWTYGMDPNDPVTFAKVLTETRGGTNSSGVPAGGTVTYRYERLNQNIPLGDPDLPRGRVTITERNGNQREFYGNERGEHILTQHLTRGLRPGEPPYYATRSYYDDDGLLIRRILPLGNEMRWTYDSGNMRGQQKNVIEIRRVTDAARGGGEDLVTRMTYEPLYNRQLTVTDPRGNARQYEPPNGGTASPDRYTQRFYYDYQEGPDSDAHRQRLADSLGISLQELTQSIERVETQVEATLGLTAGTFRLLRGEDLNDDGRTDQIAGNLVRMEEPQVTLLPDSGEAARLGRTNQAAVTQMQWNRRGQIARTIDPEGNVTLYDYYPENDPDGDGNNLIPSGSTEPTGYLRTVTLDAEISSRRTATAAPTALSTTWGYDEVENVTWVKNPRGVITRIEVNALNEAVVVTRGAEVDAARAAGQLLTDEEPFLYQTRLYYDHNGRVVKRFLENRDGTTEGIGAFAKRFITYDILHNVVQREVEIDAFTRLVTRHRYDANERLTQVIQPAGNERRMTYDERDLLLTSTRGFGSPEASTIQADYDDNGNTVRRTDAADKDGDGQREATIHAYDGFDRRIKVTDALGNEMHTGYDVADSRVSTRFLGHPAGRPGAPNVLLAEERYLHDERNRVFQTDQKLFLSDGFTTVRPVDLRDDNGDGFVKSRFEYDALSRLTLTIEDDGEAFARTYDGASRLIKLEDALGNRQVREYDQNSNAVRITIREISPEGLVPEESFTTHRVFDQLDRLVRVTDNAGQTWRFAYDSRDNLIARSDPEASPVVDTLGLFPGEINAPGNTHTFHYDGRDLLIREVCDLRQGGTGGGALDVDDVYNPDGQIILRHLYDGNARPMAFVDDNGNRTSFGYDALNRRTSETHADGTAYAHFYDRDDNLLRVIDPNGSEIHRSFDALGRLVRCSIARAPGLGGTTRETYAYDGLSRPTESTDDNGDPSAVQSCAMIYDSLSRLLEERQNGQPISNVFTGDEKRVRCTYPGGRQITNTFDAIDRVKTVSDQDGLISTAFYVGPGLRELKRTHGNGTSLSFLNDAENADAGYDPVKRIVRLRCFLPSGAEAFLDRAYGYNRAGQRTFEKRRDDFELTDRYAYDSVYRLVSTLYDQDAGPGATQRDVARVDYRLDGVGNRRKVTEVDLSGRTTILLFAANEVNEYTEVAGVSEIHDDNGNLIDDGEHRFVYDYRNRPVSVFRKRDDALLARYLYHADNRRARKIVFNPDEPGTVEKEALYFYDGWQVCEEQNADGATETTYVYSPVYIDDIVQMKRAPAHPLGEGMFYLHQNARMDVVALTDASGSVVERRFYDDYGRSYDEGKQATLQSAVGNPYGFQGRQLDPETGLYYFRQRYYRPERGRFLQRDPMWNTASLGNLYAFVQNKPVSAIDPAGLEEQESVLGAMVEGFFEGLGDGAVVLADKFTFGMIDSLHQESRSLIRSYGKVGKAMDITSDIAVAASLAALAPGAGSVTGTQAVRGASIIVGNVVVKHASEHIAEEIVRPHVHKALAPLREPPQPMLVGMNPGMVIDPLELIKQALASRGIPPDKIAQLMEDITVEAAEQALQEIGSAGVERIVIEAFPEQHGVGRTYGAIYEIPEDRTSPGDKYIGHTTDCRRRADEHVHDTGKRHPDDYIKVFPHPDPHLPPPEKEASKMAIDEQTAIMEATRGVHPRDAKGISNKVNAVGEARSGSLPEGVTSPRPSRGK